MGEDVRKTRQSEVRVTNADVWAAGWITYWFYKFLDDGEIIELRVNRVARSPRSIDLNFLVTVSVFAGGYVAGKVLDLPWEYATAHIREMLVRWKENRKQTDLRIFIDGEEIR